MARKHNLQERELQERELYYYSWDNAIESANNRARHSGVRQRVRRVHSSTWHTGFRDSIWSVNRVS